MKKCKTKGEMDRRRRKGAKKQPNKRRDVDSQKELGLKVYDSWRKYFSSTLRTTTSEETRAERKRTR